MMRIKQLIILFVFMQLACGQRDQITIQARFFDETASAADRQETVEVIAKRFANFLGRKPSIVFDSMSGTMTFTLPYLKNTAIYTSLITSGGRLAFMETFSFSEVGFDFFEMVTAMAEDQEFTNILAEADTSYKNLFFAALPNIHSNGDFINDPVFVRARSTDTAMVSRILNDTVALAYMGQDIIFRWYYDHDNDICNLIGIKPAVGYTAVTNTMMDQIGAAKSDYGGYYINVRLHPQYHNTWSKLTRENIGSWLALVMDDKVLSYPLVNAEISSGNSSIGGHLDKSEARMIESILKSGETKTSLMIVR
jgi:hypothetical protein